MIINGLFNYITLCMHFTKKSILLLFSVIFLTASAFSVNLSHADNKNFCLSAPSAQAADLWGDQEGMDKIGGKFGETGNSSTDIREIIAEIIKTLLEFLAIIFVVLIIIAGFKWMTSGGNQDQIKEAKGQLSRAIIGLIIILSAYAITYLVFEILIKATTGQVWT
jgi:hypothetical protein